MSVSLVLFHPSTQGIYSHKTLKCFLMRIKILPTVILLSNLSHLLSKSAPYVLYYFYYSYIVIQFKVLEISGISKCFPDCVRYFGGIQIFLWQYKVSLHRQKCSCLRGLFCEYHQQMSVNNNKQQKSLTKAERATIEPSMQVIPIMYWP